MSTLMMTTQATQHSSSSIALKPSAVSFYDPAVQASVNGTIAIYHNLEIYANKFSKSVEQ